MLLLFYRRNPKRKFEVAELVLMALVVDPVEALVRYCRVKHLVEYHRLLHLTFAVESVAMAVAAVVEEEEEAVVRDLVINEVVSADTNQKFSLATDSKCHILQ